MIRRLDCLLLGHDWSDEGAFYFSWCKWCGYEWHIDDEHDSYRGLLPILLGHWRALRFKAFTRCEHCLRPMWLWSWFHDHRKEVALCSAKCKEDWRPF